MCVTPIARNTGCLYVLILDTGRRLYIRSCNIYVFRFCFWGARGGDQPHSVILYTDHVNESSPRRQSCPLISFCSVSSRLGTKRLYTHLNSVIPRTQCLSRVLLHGHLMFCLDALVASFLTDYRTSASNIDWPSTRTTIRRIHRQKRLHLVYFVA